MTYSNKLFRNDLNDLCMFVLDYPLIFPEDAEIRIPPEPAKNCSAKLEVKNFFKIKINVNIFIFE